MHRILTASWGLIRDKRDVSSTGKKRKIFQLRGPSAVEGNKVFFVGFPPSSDSCALFSPQIVLSNVSWKRRHIHWLGVKWSRVEQCAPTDGAEGMRSVEPTPSSIKQRTAPVTVRVTAAFRCRQKCGYSAVKPAIRYTWEVRLHKRFALQQ